MLLSELFHRVGFDIDYGALDKLNAKMLMAKEQTDHVFGSMSKIAQGVGNVGRSLSMWVTAPIVGFGALSVKTAADVEQLELAIRDVVPAGTDIKKLFNDLNMATRQSTFKKSEVYEYANALIQAKIPISNVTSMIKKLGDINAANAGKMGVGNTSNMGGMVNALTQLKIKGFADAGALQAFGPAVMLQMQKQLGMSGKLFQAYMSTGIVSYDQVIRAVDAVARERDGYMLRQANTLNGLFSRMGVAVRDFASEIGVLIMNDLHLKDVLTFLIDKMYKLLDLFKKLPGWVRTGILVLAVLAALVGPVLMLVSAVMSMVSSVAMGILMLDALGVSVAALIPAIGAAIAAFLPWLFIIGAIGFALFLLYDDFVNWEKNNKSILGKILGPWQDWHDKMVFWFKDVSQIALHMLELFSIVGTGAGVQGLIDDFKKGRFQAVGSKAFQGLSGAISPMITKDLQPAGTNLHTQINIQVPYGTSEDQQQFLKDTTKQVFDEHFNHVLNQTNNANTFSRTK
jgi:hypothetical protein